MLSMTSTQSNFMLVNGEDMNNIKPQIFRETLHISFLTEYYAPVWLNSCYNNLIHVQLNHTLQLITGTIRPTPTYWLPLLNNIEPPAIRRIQAWLREHRKIQDNPDLPVQEDTYSRT